MAVSSAVPLIIVGVVSFNAIPFLPPLPTASAAWGWEMTVPTDLTFKCSEGVKLGCPYGTHLMVGSTNCTAGSATTCPAACFACTVEAKTTGHTCDVSTTSVHCTANSTSIMPSAQDQSFLCINIGMGAAHPANGAELGWSTVPACASSSTAAAADADYGIMTKPGIFAMGFVATISVIIRSL